MPQISVVCYNVLFLQYWCLSETAISFSLCSSSNRACWSISALTLDILTHLLCVTIEKSKEKYQYLCDQKKRHGHWKVDYSPFSQESSNFVSIKQLHWLLRYLYLSEQSLLPLGGLRHTGLWIHSWKTTEESKWVLDTWEAKMPPTLTHCKLFHCS